METARRQLNQADLAGVLDAMREGLQVIDREWRYVFLNEAALSHARKTREELIDRSMLECYPGIEQTEMFSLLRRCMEHRVTGAMLNEFEYGDGAKRIFELRVEPCQQGISVLSIDVTEGRKLEAQLQHAQKMEAVGRLAGSVAHDFNNLLSVILSYASLLLTDLKPLDPIRNDIRAIHSAGERAARLTQQLLAFSRQQLSEPRALDLNQVLTEAEKMLSRLLGADVELVTCFERSLGRVHADPGQIDQIVMNLAINARDAMPDGGKLTIETQNVVLDAEYASEHYGVAPGQYVMMAVSDTGVGMDRATQTRIFEPFFTTKEVGRGTGLGLSTVFGLVQQSGGHIWVYSEPNAGATFKVYFPAVGDVPLESVETSEAVSLRGSETVLLVEDQDEVRRIAAQILRRCGYHVIEAQNAGEALLTCERHPRAIQLLLTDVVMPRMSGPELAERLLQIRPEMRVLCMSGYAEGTHQRRALDAAISYLQKPITPDLLARRVREVLDAPTRSWRPRAP